MNEQILEKIAKEITTVERLIDKHFDNLNGFERKQITFLLEDAGVRYKRKIIEKRNRTISEFRECMEEIARKGSEKEMETARQIMNGLNDLEDVNLICENPPS